MRYMFPSNQLKMEFPIILLSIILRKPAFAKLLAENGLTNKTFKRNSTKLRVL